MERINSEESTPKIVGFGYEVGFQPSIRWKGGLRFGSRQVITPYSDDETGQKHYRDKEYGPWTWYSWRFKRIGGPDQNSPLSLTMDWQSSNPDITTVGMRIEDELVGKQELNMDHPLKPRQIQDTI